MTGISAQVSLYPLGQEDLSPAIDSALRIFKEHNLDVDPGRMSSLLSGDDKAVFAALQETFQVAAGQGQVVMVVTFSNACPVPQSKKESRVEELKQQIADLKRRWPAHSVPPAMMEHLDELEEALRMEFERGGESNGEQ